MSFIWDLYVCLAMLSQEMHGIFVLGVVLVYRLTQVLGVSFPHVAMNFYWKDV